MLKRFARLIVLMAVLATPALAGTELIVYTDMEPDVLSRYSKDIAAKFPEYSVKWVRESAGPITARLLAEKDNPQAEMILGLALSGVLSVDRQGGLESYRPDGFDQVLPIMRDGRDNPIWIGNNVMVGAIAVNTRELEALGVPVPETWQDLVKPEYKGLIVMPNPVSSGTAYMHVNAWLQSMGEDKAWEFMEALHKNVKMYVHSGSKPAQMAAMGEVPIGLTVDAYIAPYIKKRAPVKSVLAKDGVGYEIIASAVVKNGKHPEAAQKLMDYSVSKGAAEIGMEFDYFPVRADIDNERLVEIRERLFPVDHNRSADARDAVLAEWRRRFGGE